MPLQPENRLSLRRRLLRRLLAPLLLVLAASSVISYVVAAHFSSQEYNAFLYDSVQTLAQQVEPGAHGPILDLPKIAERMFLWDATDITYFRVYGKGSGQIAGDPAMPSKLHSVENFRGVSIGTASLHGNVVRVATLELTSPELGDQVYVQVAETQNRRAALTRQILMRVLLPQLCLVIVVIVVIGRGVRRGLEPLQTMTIRLERQNQNALQPIPDEGAPSEVHALTHALNDLLSRLDAAMAVQRKFIADAAHQLRTPLTALKLNIDRALQEPDLTATRAILEQAHVSTERAVRLSRQLLSLARMDSGNDSNNGLVPADLRLLAQQAGAEWVPVALARGIDLSLEAGDSPVWIQADAMLLHEVIANLLDNAIKYASCGRCIVLAVTSHGDCGTLAVRDAGPGIPPELRDHMFERFVRGDSGGDGTGLGLAIVREIAQLHGARISHGTGLDGRGLAVIIEFPLVYRST
ncbi:MAG: sensor histidine kinase [Stenotrophobium sp.]